MTKVCRARVAGPLAAHAEGFRAELSRLGYRPGSAELQMLLMGRVSRWLAREGLAAGDLTAVRVERMVASWMAAAAPGARVPTARSLVALLGCLRREGVLAAESDPPGSALDDLLADYRRHLARDRGLAARTIHRYEVTARRFLDGRRAVGGGKKGAEGLSGGEVTGFLRPRRRPRHAQEPGPHRSAVRLPVHRAAVLLPDRTRTPKRDDPRARHRPAAIPRPHRADRRPRLRPPRPAPTT